MSAQTMHTLFILIQVGPVLLIFVTGSFFVFLAFKKKKQERIESEKRQSEKFFASDITHKIETHDQ